MLIVKLLNVGLQQASGLRKLRKNQNHTMAFSKFNSDTTIDEIKNEIEKNHSSLIKITSKSKIVKIR